MRKFAVLFFAFVFFSPPSYTQCDCPDLPPDPADQTTVTVSSVSQLQNALINCNQNDGNYTILLENGVYTLSNNLLYISPNMKHLTIRSVSGERDSVVIQGQGMGGNVGWGFNVAASHFTLADLTVGSVANHPIHIHAEHNADSCLIQNVRIFDAREQMLKVSGNNSNTFSDGGIVQCCLFEFPGGVGYQYYTGGVDAHNAKEWIVRNNTFRHIRSPENLLAEHAIHFWSDSENTLVENNTIINCDRGVGFGLGSSQHHGGIIRNNFVHTSRDVGIGLESSPDTKVYHNTVITENYFNSIEYRFAVTENVHIANNLCNKNIASRDGGSGLVESNFKSTDLSNFTDPANYDYHLDGNAEPGIINSGIVIPDAEEDFDCHLRTDGMPDIGADEFDSTPVSTGSLLDRVQITVFPNPANDWMYLETPAQGLIAFCSMTGQVLKQWHVKGSSVLDLSGIPSGFYTLIFQTKGEIITLPVCKN